MNSVYNVETKAEATMLHPPFTDSMNRIALNILALQAKYKILEQINNDALAAAKAAMCFPKT